MLFLDPHKHGKKWLLLDRQLLNEQTLQIFLNHLLHLENIQISKTRKEILATLFFQSGNNITERSPVTGEVSAVIDKDLEKEFEDASGTPTESVLDFYTSFANPSKSLYSWNRSLPNSENAFLNGDLAFYFGYASEIKRIQDKNPNLNFDVDSNTTGRWGSSKCVWKNDSVCNREKY
jgi:hypothetical protein